MSGSDLYMSIPTSLPQDETNEGEWYGIAT